MSFSNTFLRKPFINKNGAGKIAKRLSKNNDIPFSSINGNLNGGGALLSSYNRVLTTSGIKYSNSGLFNNKSTRSYLHSKEFTYGTI